MFTRLDDVVDVLVPLYTVLMLVRMVALRLSSSSSSSSSSSAERKVSFEESQDTFSGLTNLFQQMVNVVVGVRVVGDSSVGGGSPDLPAPLISSNLVESHSTSTANTPTATTLERPPLPTPEKCNEENTGPPSKTPKTTQMTTATTTTSSEPPLAPPTGRFLEGTYVLEENRNVQPLMAAQGLSLLRRKMANNVSVRQDIWFGPEGSNEISFRLIVSLKGRELGNKVATYVLDAPEPKRIPQEEINGAVLDKISLVDDYTYRMTREEESGRFRMDITASLDRATQTFLTIDSVLVDKKGSTVEATRIFRKKPSPSPPLLPSSVVETSLDTRDTARDTNENEGCPCPPTSSQGVASSSDKDNGNGENDNNESSLSTNPIPMGGGEVDSITENGLIDIHSNDPRNFRITDSFDLTGTYMRVNPYSFLQDVGKGDRMDDVFQKSGHTLHVFHEKANDPEGGNTVQITYPDSTATETFDFTKTTMTLTSGAVGQSCQWFRGTTVATPLENGNGLKIERISNDEDDNNNNNMPQAADIASTLELTSSVDDRTSPGIQLVQINEIYQWSDHGNTLLHTVQFVFIDNKQWNFMHTFEKMKKNTC